MAVKRFNKVLVANRGEVAVRVIQACRELNVATAAVYSEADKHSRHVALADEGIFLGGGPASETYLDQQRLLAAIEQVGADAVHPGFGFLSESADFARACEQAGVVFIGPGPEVMTLMASKSASKALVESLDIPVIPGNSQPAQSAEQLVQQAEAIGYPVLIKASAGGGGMGMRVVDSGGEFPEALRSAKREAMSAFGDDAVLVEKYFRAVRHIEVQIVADQYGTVVHCFERECSVQRRRQKVVEEAPSPSVGERLREKLTSAAVKIAASVDYVSLGTVEFLVDDGTEDYYFLEMNTRLQVEHGITEAITGIDLVKTQIRIAEGEPLKLSQADISIQGHAIECRLYAEDTEADFAPATGTVLQWRPYESDAGRIDSAIIVGTELSALYDPMIAKLISHGEDRETALRAMRRCLERTVLLGLISNQRFLLQLIRHPAFADGLTTTDFIERHKNDLLKPLAISHRTALFLIAAVQRARSRFLASGQLRVSEHNYPLQLSGGSDGEQHHVAVLAHNTDHFSASIDGQSYEVEILKAPGNSSAGRIAIDGHSHSYSCATRNNGIYIHLGGQGPFSLEFLSRFSRGIQHDNVGGFRAAMPGRVVAVQVKAGSEVRIGDKLITMESMKMEHTTLSDSDGMVSELHVAVGDIVEKGKLLIEIETGD